MKHMKDYTIIEDKELSRPIYSRCPATLKVNSILINPRSQKRLNLIRLRKEYYKSIFDRIYDVKGFGCTGYVIFKFAEIYLEGDLTLGECMKIGNDFDNHGPTSVGLFATHEIIKKKYRLYNSDDKLKENYRELALQVLRLFMTFEELE